MRSAESHQRRHCSCWRNPIPFASPSFAVVVSISPSTHLPLVLFVSPAHHPWFVSPQPNPPPPVISFAGCLGSLLFLWPHPEVIAPGSGECCVSFVPDLNPCSESAVASVLTRPKLGVEPQPGPVGMNLNRKLVQRRSCFAKRNSRMESLCPILAGWGE